MKKQVLIPVANGTEEIEALAVADILRRAGAEVTLASVTENLQIAASRGTNFIADTTIENIKNQIFDLIVVPGGMPGAEHLQQSELLTAMLIAQKNADRFYAAICAAPVIVLQYHKLTEGLPVTCHPSMASDCLNFQDERVIVSKKCITSQGPGTAIEFALVLVEALFSKELSTKIATAIVF